MASFVQIGFCLTWLGASCLASCGGSEAAAAGENGTVAPAQQDVDIDGGSQSVGARSAVDASRPEACDDGLDNDQDTRVDEGCPCEPGAMQTCFGGAARRAGVGLCHLGEQHCRMQGEFASWGVCEDWVPAVEERCNGEDDDCDAVSDESCPCGPDAQRPCCSDGQETPEGDRCVGGVQLCSDGRWGGCDVLASADPAATYLKAINTGADDEFGFSVALSGDTLAIGSWRESSAATGIDGDWDDDSALGAGAVYIFTRSQFGTWSQQAYLKASNADPGDAFGYSVDLNGDTLAVGATREASSATGVDGDQTSNAAGPTGAVYVFARSIDTWSQQAYLKASTPASSTAFGSDVALFGDTLAVGSVGPAGVSIFVRSGSSWSLQAELTADSPDEFGRDVALFGDTLAIGAPLEDSAATGVTLEVGDSGANDSGAVYVYTRTGGSWSQQAYFKASNTDRGDQFGSTVALFGDTLAVGAPVEASGATGIDGDQNDNSESGAGAVYIFSRSDNTWAQQAYLKASDTDPGDVFGSRVALFNDGLAVGSRREASAVTGIDADATDNSAPASGATVLFSRSGNSWTQRAYVKATNTDADDSFGAGVALTADTLAVGAPKEASAATGVGGDQADNSALRSGAVYVYSY